MSDLVPSVEYNPFDQRTPDTQIHDLVRRILSDGRWDNPIQGHSCQIAGAELRYDMRNGFPLMTERDMTCPIPLNAGGEWPSIFDQSIGELVAFVNGAQTKEEYESFGCLWWRRWLTKAKCEFNHLEEGDNGPGSYGAVLARFPTHNAPPHHGESFDQIEGVFAEMAKYPNYRSHMTTTWCPPYAYAGDNRMVVVAPCHGTALQYQLDPERKELRLVHIQRSCDVLVGGIGNIAQYAAINGLVAAQILGYTFVEYVHYLMQPHIYKGQMDGLEEFLSRKPRPFPTVRFVGEVTSIKQVRPEHFVIEDYHPHDYYNIPTPI